MDYQKYFNKFHEQIKLSNENKYLITSREAIKKSLKAGLEKVLKHKGISIPTFFDQGSYAMGTGIKPTTGEVTFDIDEGVIFDIRESDYSDPTVVKKWVAEALSDQTKMGSSIKEPCVRVVYSENDEEKYHVDLAIYCRIASEIDSPLRLARGKEFSADENKYWDPSDPITLKNLINNKFSGESSYQFKRIIRYLKRWKDVQFSSNGNSKPSGISLTVLAYLHFQPSFDMDGNPQDIFALQGMLSRALNGISHSTRMQVLLPTTPYNDLLSRMSDLQYQNFYEKLLRLSSDIDYAIEKKDEAVILSTLASQFGDDFPIDPEDTKKAMVISVNKPLLGYHPDIANPGNWLEKEEITLRGFLKIHNQANPIPIESDKKVFAPKQFLYFRANYDGDFDRIAWQVVNTGSHVLEEYNNGKSNAFRGDLDDAKVPNTNRTKYGSSDMYKKSQNPLETWEHTEYTGKHWMQCFAFNNGVCVAKSKKFYVNIYNAEHPNYD